MTDAIATPHRTSLCSFFAKPELEGLKALEAAGVVRRISETAWDQQCAADELFELLERYEEAIASGR
jgi:hypothetical protein